MMLDTDAIVSMAEAEEDFSRVTRIADQYGQAVIFKHDKPKYVVIDLEKVSLTDDEEIDLAAAEILKKYKPAFQELAK